jgi:gluconokinase
MDTDVTRPAPAGHQDDSGHRSAEHLVVMGVAGSGKTTVAGRLAARLDLVLAEADEFHPAANIAKMSAGTPLTDADRAPWLAAIRDWLSSEADAGHAAVVTCSALKRTYRDVLRSAHGTVRFVHLDGSAELLAGRIGERSGHFMPPTLLPSQLADLEPLADDEDGVVVDATATPDEIVETVLAWLDRT